MAKKLPRNIVRGAMAPVAEDDEALRKARERFGSRETVEAERGAWAQAGNAVRRTELARLQGERIEKLLAGDLVFELDPAQIEDTVGSDRSTLWKEDEAFEALKASIAENGQDVPVQVAPADGPWEPVFDETDGIVTKDVRFTIIGGRRRLEALRQIGRKVRAVCVSLNPEEPSFDSLYRRYRENAERENLSLLDEFLSLGEMFSHAKTLDPKVTGRTVAVRLGVTEPRVSRGRVLFENRDRLFEELDAPHHLTFHQIDALIPALRKGDPLPSFKEQETPEKGENAQPAPKRRTISTLKRTQIIKGRKITAKARAGKITIDLGSESKIDETLLDHLLLFIQQKGASET